MDIAYRIAYRIDCVRVYANLVVKQWIASASEKRIDKATSASTDQSPIIILVLTRTGRFVNMGLQAQGSKQVLI